MGLGDDPTQWAWGRFKGYVLRSDLNQFGISRYNNPLPGQMLFARDGAYETVSRADPSLDPVYGWVTGAGSSTRLVCEAFPTGPECTIQLPGGQSAHIDSPSYDDLLLEYLDNEPIDLVFDIEEAKANAVRTVKFD